MLGLVGKSTRANNDFQKSQGSMESEQKSTKSEVHQKSPVKLGNLARTQSSFSASFDIAALSAKVQDTINYEYDDGSKGPIEKFRTMLKHTLEHTFIGHVYNQFMLILSVLSCFQFIYQTYLSKMSEFGRSRLYFLINIELVIACLFLFDWCAELFIAELRIAHVTGFFPIVDLMTVIPVFVTYGRDCPRYEMLDSFGRVFIYIVCGMNSMRILRALRFRKRFYLIEDSVRRYLADMSLKIVVMILFNAALLQYLEPAQDLEFHTWCYFMLVTITTVGYGDLSPITTLGRFFTMAMIIVAIIVVPQMSNELMELVAQQSYYARVRYQPKTRKSQHVLVCGDLNSSSLWEFFNELFHEDHDIRDMYAVIMQPTAPTYEILQILRDVQFSSVVTFLQGNALNAKDLHRAMASKARAIFILTNKFSSDPDEEDAKTILQQFSIQKFLRMNSDSSGGGNSSSSGGASGGSEHETLFCLQLIRPENKRHLVTSQESEHKDLVVCLNEIKMGVIAKAVVFPGANTLIMNLLTSFADEEAPTLAAFLMEEEIETLDEDENNDWIGEYQRGCDWEIYTTELAKEFEGNTFCALSEILYQKLGIVLFALEVEDIRKDKVSGKLLLNPAEFIIPPKSDFKIQAFVLAKNKAQSDLSFLKGEHDGMFGSAVNFSQLSMLANGLAQRVTGGHSNTRVLPMDGRQYTEGMNGDEQREYREMQAWQALLRRHETEKSNETLQEEQQRMEDLHLKENYFIRDTHMDLADAMIKTSVTEEMGFVDNHVIIIGKALSNLYDLIRPLRAKHLGELKHIIILYPYDFPVAVWQRISIFESVWILRGSALEEADIRRAGIFKAKQVVVLADASMANASSASSGSSAGLDALVDADAIFCYQCVRKMNEQAHVVVEIVRHTNVKYLDPETGLKSSDVDYKFTPQFAAGALFATSLLDTLACQAFYNTKIIDVVNKLIGGVDQSVTTKPKTGNLSPGKSFSSARDPITATLISSALYQIPIPDGLESRTYGALYRLLARRKQIPLGILRGVFSHTKSGPKANKMPYVFTNPPKDTELFTCDKVFVLSQTPISASRYARDETREMHMYSNIRQRKKTTDDVIAQVAALKEDMLCYRTAHHRLEQQQLEIADEINYRFEVLFKALNIIPSDASPPPLQLAKPGSLIKNLPPKLSRGRTYSSESALSRTRTASNESALFAGSSGNRSRAGSRDFQPSPGAIAGSGSALKRPLSLGSNFGNTRSKLSP